MPGDTVFQDGKRLAATKMIQEVTSINAWTRGFYIEVCGLRKHMIGVLECYDHQISLAMYQLFVNMVA